MKTHWGQLLKWAEAEVRATRDALPPDLRARLAPIPVTYEPRPTPAMEADDGIAPDTLGLFVGDALPDGDLGRGETPTQIILFLENLWDYADGDVPLFRDELHTTLLHEIGHFLGLDEGELGDRGLE